MNEPKETLKGCTHFVSWLEVEITLNQHHKIDPGEPPNHAKEEEVERYTPKNMKCDNDGK
jgi:hypothetical protein